MAEAQARARVPRRSGQRSALSTIDLSAADPTAVVKRD
jgi:hypothetical protein